MPCLLGYKKIENVAHEFLNNSSRAYCVWKLITPKRIKKIYSLATTIFLVSDKSPDKMWQK